jgi:hypothetical protein
VSDSEKKAIFSAQRKVDFSKMFGISEEDVYLCEDSGKFNGGVNFIYTDQISKRKTMIFVGSPDTNLFVNVGKQLDIVEVTGQLYFGYLPTNTSADLSKLRRVNGVEVDDDIRKKFLEPNNTKFVNSKPIFY